MSQKVNAGKPVVNQLGGRNILGTPVNGDIVVFDSGQDSFVYQSPFRGASSPVIKVFKAGLTILNNVTRFTEIINDNVEFNTDTSFFTLQPNGRVRCLFTGFIVIHVQASMEQTSADVGLISDKMIMTILRNGTALPTGEGIIITGMSGRANSALPFEISTALSVTVNDEISYFISRGVVTGNTYGTAISNGFRLVIHKL